MHRSQGRREHPVDWSLGTPAIATLEEWAKPNCVGGDLETEKTRGKRRTWGEEQVSRRCCFLHTDIWKEEGCVRPEEPSR